MTKSDNHEPSRLDRRGVFRGATMLGGLGATGLLAQKAALTCLARLWPRRRHKTRRQSQERKGHSSPRRSTSCVGLSRTRPIGCRRAPTLTIMWSLSEAARRA